ncbi:MAG: hypothetical protein IPK00_10205 [Deltaproteobacteria bacterium]|nr:hypothetical protein [Deltaproteobacteria bacterium]
MLLEPGRTRIVQWFEGRPEPIERPEAVSLPASAFAAHDCETCHAERERIVGPAWQEIAARHAGANRNAAAAMLATRIREGGVGRWGPVAMPPHLALSHAEATALALRVLETELEAEDAEAAATATATAAATAARAGAGAPGSNAAAAREVATTYAYDAGPRPASLHPALRATSIAPPGFTPRVAAGSRSCPMDASRSRPGTTTARSSCSKAGPHRRTSESVGSPRDCTSRSASPSRMARCT